MKQIPILFSTPMVQAILDGRKTQTRRVVKPQPELCEFEGNQTGNRVNGWVMPGTQFFWPEGDTPDMAKLKCPYGQPGDILWVRESFGVGTRPCPFNGWKDGIEYKADQALIDPDDDLPLYCYENIDYTKYEGQRGWKPSIHMPKAAARIFLRVKSVRVERVQEISEDDAKAEGVIFHCKEYGYKCYGKYAGIGPMTLTAKESFTSLWQSINGDESWNANPFVWVIEFERRKTKQRLIA